MKKMLLLAGIATVAFSVHANACDWKPYISAKLTASQLSVNTSGRYVGDGFIEKSLNSGDETQHVWGTSFAAGAASGAIRTEIEWHRNTAARMSDTNSTINAILGNTVETGKAKIKTDALLLNAYYDFETDSAFTPYVGAGIGYAKTKITQSRYVSWALEGFDKATNSHTNFAWQIGAGIAYALNDHVSIDVGYRYIDYGKFNVKNYVDEGWRDGIRRTSYEVTENELYAGIRYSF
ncbi:MAG: porin family protein [Alphaproteobacteria bacterium]|nr:porin family protein [Alphaproteobacteria bacterium]